MNEPRLRKGAQILGALWKKGDRCSWAANDCYCATPNNFCKAKELFIKLALEAGREMSLSEYGLIEMMTASEVDQLGISVKIDMGEGIGQISVGGGKSTIKMADLWKMSRELPEVLKSTLKIMSTFPGSKVEVAQ